MIAARSNFGSQWWVGGYEECMPAVRFDALDMLLELSLLDLPRASSLHLLGDRVCKLPAARDQGPREHHAAPPTPHMYPHSRA